MCELIDRQPAAFIRTGLRPGKGNVMISADKAKRMAKQIAENCVSEELSRVETMISEAVEEGRFSVCGEGSMHKATKHELERLGYNVELGSQYNNSYFPSAGNRSRRGHDND